jgi:hypothetical protein
LLKRELEKVQGQERDIGNLNECLKWIINVLILRDEEKGNRDQSRYNFGHRWFSWEWATSQ